MRHSMGARTYGTAAIVFRLERAVTPDGRPCGLPRRGSGGEAFGGFVALLADGIVLIDLQDFFESPDSTGAETGLGHMFTG